MEDATTDRAPAQPSNDNKMDDVQFDNGRLNGGSADMAPSNKRKRARDDSDDEDSRAPMPRGDERQRDYDHRPRHPPRQRRRMMEQPSITVRKQLLSIAENPQREINADMTSVAAAIVEHANDEYFTQYMTELIVKLSLEQPFKIPFVAGVCLHTNVGSSEFIKDLLVLISDRVKAGLEAGDFRVAKLLLGLLSCMQTLFEGEGVFAFFKELVDLSSTLQSESDDEATGLELVKIVLLNVPYAVAFSEGDKGHELARQILEKTKAFANTPIQNFSRYQPFVGEHGKAENNFSTYVYHLHKQLESESASGFPIGIFERVHLPLLDTEKGQNSQKHAFPLSGIQDGSKINLQGKPIWPSLFFSVFVNQSIETVPNTSTIASSMIRDILSETMNGLDFNRGAAAQMMVDIDCYLKLGTFAQRATHIDNLPSADSGQSTWKPEDVIIDAVFAELMRLPEPVHKPVYYHSIITELCRLTPKAIAPTLGRAIRYLHRNVDIMDAELVKRTFEWFSHHVSNFDFSWKWSEWLEDLDLAFNHPRNIFLRGTVDKELRLSYATRIRMTLPDEFLSLVPEIPEGAAIPEFEFAKDQTSKFPEEAKRLLAAVEKKVPAQEIDTLLNEFRENQPDEQLAIVDFFMSCVCFAGRAALWHILAYVERYRGQIVALNECHSLAPLQIMQSIACMFATLQPGYAVNVIDKMLNYSIVTPANVFGWALDPHEYESSSICPGYSSIQERMSQPWVFELVMRTMLKVNGRLEQVGIARRTAAKARADASGVLYNTADERRAEEAQVSELLQTEQASTADLYRNISNSLDTNVINAMHPVDESSRRNKIEPAYAQALGMKWRRVFERMQHVQDLRIRKAVHYSELLPEPALIPAGSGGDSGDSGESAVPGQGNGVERDEDMEDVAGAENKTVATQEQNEEVL